MLIGCIILNAAIGNCCNEVPQLAGQTTIIDKYPSCLNSEACRLINDTCTEEGTWGLLVDHTTPYKAHHFTLYRQPDAEYINIRRLFFLLYPRIAYQVLSAHYDDKTNTVDVTVRAYNCGEETSTEPPSQYTFAGTPYTLLEPHTRLPVSNDLIAVIYTAELLVFLLLVTIFYYTLKL